MAAGDVLSAEKQTFRDPVSGATVTQLTDHLAHSHHPYFTNQGFWDGGTRLIFGSDRHNATNLYSIELASGQITQITDFSRGECSSLLRSFVNPSRDEAYFVAEADGHQAVLAADLKECATRQIWPLPEGYLPSMLSVTADGRTVCIGIQEDLSSRIRTDMHHGYVGFDETFEARPHCQIMAIDIDSGEARLLHEDHRWIGHVNTSSTDPDLLTFCHEGPWHRLQRLWGLRISTREVRQLRPQEPGEAIGHEYWFSDGRRVGYHGWLNPEQHLFGYVDWETGERREWPWSGRSMHFHSIDETLIVGDGFVGGNPNLLLWKLEGEQYVGPRILMNHRGSYHAQKLHPHPHMFRGADGETRVLLTADPQAYGQVFIVDVPPFQSLPEAT